MCNMIFLDYMTGHVAFHNFKMIGCERSEREREKNEVESCHVKIENSKDRGKRREFSSMLKRRESEKVRENNNAYFVLKKIETER